MANALTCRTLLDEVRHEIYETYIFPRLVPSASEHKPVCKNNATIIVGAALEEATRVLCEVDAYPAPKNFQWMLNNSMGTKELDTLAYAIHRVLYQQANYTAVNGRSILSYTPTSEVDYGTLSCRATNLAGQQIDACHYTFAAGGATGPAGELQLA
ncbi:hypothetical protein EVAR_43400_1 [Eumeta japonica]|uniref:Ig-like domain-containing protein n=1 Tax=Eumeta variegata TaxID=151549 RepID=A0A4C1WWH7_EUMVA|nr:hypothetical protein EVAR_43400_1 [Eumeta japonica]